MNPRRKSLLKSVQNLAIWAEVVKSEDASPDFDSGTELMRAFWSNRRQEIEKAGFAAVEREELLARLIDYMETHATLSAPRRLIEAHEGLATELQTQNVIHVEKHSVSFCHQSYLDFLIANRVLGQLVSGSEAVLDWLGDRNEQSLFRREQLRQLLFLLAEESPQDLASSLDELLTSDDVRFHIRQLVIEAIGQLRPVPALINRVITMAENDKWREHVIRDVLYGNVDWMKAFHRSGRLFEWLLSSDEQSQNTARWLITSVAETVPTLLSAAIATADEAGSKEFLRETLHYSKPNKEPDDVFDFRLACLVSGNEPPYVAWKGLADSCPDRAMRLLAALLAQPSENRKAKPAARRLEMDSSDDVKALVNAARRCPRLTLRVLVPILTSTAKQILKEHRDWKNRASIDELVTYPQTRDPKILLTVVRAAAVTLARSFPDRFERLSRRLGIIPSRAIQALLVRGWSTMATEYADAAIGWLLSDQRRFRCGSQRRKPRWCAAARLIRKMSPHCSDDRFGRLENTLLDYRDPDEKRLASYWLRDTRDGCFRNQFFAAQRFLLPALDPARRKTETTGRIGVLEREFSDYSTESFLGVRSRGGYVRSPLSQNKLSRISDKQWLRLIGNRSIPSHDDPERSPEYHPNEVIESSIEMFARDFGIAAKREPTRFAKLALEIPADAPPDYISEVFSGLSLMKPPDEVPTDEREAWQPAPRELIEETLESVKFSDDSNSMRRLCWLLRGREDIRPSDRVVDRLIELTRHAHPEPDELVVGCDKAAADVGVERLETNAINCVRSLAAIAIGSLLYDHRELFPRFRPALERLLHDPHPAVRTAMVEACLPIWNIDRPLAVSWFLTIVTNDLRPACGRYAQRFCNCAFPAFAEQLTPLMHSMCDSQVPEIANEGAQEATARWLFFGLFDGLVAKCRSGSEPQREGVAAIVAQFVRDDKYAEKCWPILRELCEDGSNDVRQKVVQALHDERILCTPGTAEFLKSFLVTQAFDDDPGSLFDALQDHPGSLIPFAELIFETIRLSMDIIRDPNQQPNRHLARNGMAAVLCSLCRFTLTRRASEEMAAPPRWRVGLV